MGVTVRVGDELLEDGSVPFEMDFEIHFEMSASGFKSYDSGEEPEKDPHGT